MPGTRTETTVEGLSELEDAFADLKKSTGKSIIRTGSIEALSDMVETAKANVHVRSGKLRDSIHAGTKVNKATKEDKENYVEVYMGPAAGVKGIVNEFGSVKMAAQPFMRPAWDNGKTDLLNRMIDVLWRRIHESAARAEAKAKRIAAKMGK